MSLGQLDTNLRRFYAEARSKSGDVYSKSTLLGFRHGIERDLNTPPLNKGLKLTSDPRFKRSNEMLNATVVSLKRQGKENVKHKPAIENEDLLRLKSSQVLALSSPVSLLRNVWFHIVLFFCRRGREGQRTLKTTSFKFEVDPTGRNYATMAHDEATKNHPGGIADVPSTAGKVGPNVRNRRGERRLQGLEIVHVQIKPEERVVFPISTKVLEFRRQHLV